MAFLRSYRQYGSPLLGRHCRFHPSCSEYMMEALEAKGIARGLALGIWRLIRCQPFSRGGWDPVPSPRAGSAMSLREN